MWITSSLKAAKAPTDIALGNFDGVHLGHQQVMAQILRGQSLSDKLIAQPLAAYSTKALQHGAIAGYSQLPSQPQPSAYELPAGLAKSHSESRSTAQNLDQSSATYATVVTFSPHPQEYFSGVSKPLLTPVAEKTWQLAQLGIQQLVMLPFNQALAELSPEEFVEQILIKGLQARRISVGSDFRFGKGRSGDAAGLQIIAASYGVPVVQVPLKYQKGDRISSSRIRQALQTGHLAAVTRLLGRPYTLTGRVVKGQQIGRTIGFPTANLQLPSDKYLPRTGVYSVWVYGVSAAPVPGVMNIGHRPTVKGQSLSVEVHLLNWAGNLYSEQLTVGLVEFVRSEQAFDSLASLKAQIAADCEVAMATLT